MNDWKVEAIPIVKCIQVIENGQDSQKRKIDILKKHNGRPILEDILLKNGVKDLPILVFSISGKTRGGKSFLMNMMIKYLEAKKHKATGDWMAGNVPNCFAWRSGVDRVTKGLWLWPVVYRLRTFDNVQVGVMLLDNEGMFAGDATDGEIIAISGISTAISYIQMFNVKDAITSDYLQNIVCNLAKGIEDLDSSSKTELQEYYKLMFVVRDWIDEEKHEFGLNGGMDYMEHERNSGSEENKLKWEEVLKTFNEIKCCLLPHPGLVALRPTFSKSGELSLLEENFLEEIKKFIENLFSPENLLLPMQMITGEGLYKKLMAADGKIADDSFSFLNMFTDHMNYIKVQNLKQEFQSMISDPDLDPQDLKTIVEDMIKKSKKSLSKGKSYQQHLDNLEEEMVNCVNRKIQGKILDLYMRYFDSNDLNNQHIIWPNIQCKMQECLCGNQTAKREATVKAVQGAAKIYYNLLSNNVLNSFSTACKTKSLRELAGFDNEFLENNFLFCTDFSDAVESREIINPIWLRQKHILRDKIGDKYLERVEELTEVKTEWLKNARKQQFEYFESCNLLNKYDDYWSLIAKEDTVLLNKIIGYAMFGFPKICCEFADDINQTTDSQTPENQSQNSKLTRYLKNIFINYTDTSNDSLGYTPEDEGKIKKVSEKITSLCITDTLELSYVFVNYQNISSPLFRVKTNQSIDSIMYIDATSRSYENFKDFITGNNLPSVIYCYPTYGSYNKSHGFSVAFAKSPATQMVSKAIKITDTTGLIVSTTSGVAAIAALVGATALGPVAIIGGGLAGVYGAVRGIIKIVDKKKHKENVNKLEYFNVFTNSLAAAGLGVGRVADTILNMASKASQAHNVFNGMVNGLQWIMKDTSDMAALINEIAENTLKILFYFNASSSEGAIQVIQKAYGMNDGAKTEDVLKELVYSNSIESTIETGNDIFIKKYVSQGVKDIAVSLLSTISREIVDVYEKYQDLDNAFSVLQLNLTILKDVYGINIEEYLNKSKGIQETIHPVLEFLLHNCSIENETIQEKITHSDHELVIKVLSLDLQSPENEKHFILIFRHIIFSIISRVREANRFYNNIYHTALALQGYDAEFHPQEEIINQIKTIMIQKKADIALTSEENFELDKLLKGILDIFLEHFQQSWNAEQCRKYLLDLSEKIFKKFDTTHHSHKQIINQQINPTCSDLERIFLKLGKYDNYGISLFEEVFGSFEHDIVNDCTTQPYFTIKLAWGGMLDQLYYFCNDKPNVSKLDLICNGLNVTKDNYSEYKCGDNLWVLLPSDECFKTYIIISNTTNNSCETGLIWQSRDKCNQVQCADTQTTEEEGNHK